MRQSFFYCQILPSEAGRLMLVLYKLPTELRCRNFVNVHRLSIQISAKCATTCMQRVRVPAELPFGIPPLLVGQTLKSGSKC